MTFGLHVANTIGKGIIDIAIVDNGIIFGTLVGACVWNVITWFLGLPTSSSHALIGGMIGAALVKAGSASLVWKGILKIFRKGQLVSAALYSLGHGGNDAQKTMGIIASLLFSAGLLGADCPMFSGYISRGVFFDQKIELF